MKKLLPVLLVLLFVFSCTTETFFFPINGTARLKDKKIVTYDVKVFFNNNNGVDELRKKEDKLNHAIRIIVAQREEKHFNSAARLKSVLKKVFKSQLRNKVKSIKINSFSIE